LEELGQIGRLSVDPAFCVAIELYLVMRAKLFLIALLMINAAASPAAEVKRVTEAMPGDDGFGFFHKPGFCRIRTKPRCNFRITSTKLRNHIIEIRIKNNFLRHRSDDEGIFDVKFRCPESLHTETVRFITAQFENKFVLKDAPAEIKIPEHKCNVEVSF